jgi:flagellar basal body-associated protein FliL
MEENIMEPEKKSNGALIGLVIIVIVLVLGGIYIWMSNKNAADAVPVQSQNTTDEDSAALDALEQELNETDTEVDVDANAVN